MSSSFIGHIDHTADKIIPTYSFSDSSQKSVPEALICTLEDISYEKVVRFSISLGGDT